MQVPLIAALLIGGCATTSGSDTLRAPAQRSLVPGFRLASANGAFEAVLQYADGNLVVYATEPRRALWASGTVNAGVRSLSLQSDGNLVLYDGDGDAVWSSGSEGTVCGHTVRLVMQNDGNMVVYDCRGARWHTGTHG